MPYTEKVNRDPAHIVRLISSYHADSRDSDKRRERVTRSIANNAAFSGRFDFSQKVDGQSCESLPKVTTAVESLSAFIRTGLSRFGEWFRVEMGGDDPILSPQDIASILKEYLRAMPDGTVTKNIEQVISDGAKAAALDSVVVFKVHGSRRDDDIPPDITIKSKRPWRLQIDVTPFEDYYPDPTGRGLYEIHEKLVDLHDLVGMAEKGVYDRNEIENLRGAASIATADKEQLDRDESDLLAVDRNTVSVREFYGTLVDTDGTLIGRSMQATVANERHLIGREKQNPLWCGSPFAVGPLTRVPHTVWHRAVMDYVSDLNQALNELFNLIFDAGQSAVHGVKEIRLDWLEDPGSIAAGIAPQQTIAVNNTAPAGASAISVARTGSLPPEVLALFQALEREILEASMTNEMRIGTLPQKQVLATEIIASNQSTAVLLDAVLGEYEHVISKALTKAWQLIVQNADNLDATSIVRAIGEEKARAFAGMQKEERFVRYVRNARVAVTGLSSISQHSRELGKLIATIATVRSDPLLGQQYAQVIDGRKLFDRLFALAGVDLRDLVKTERDLAKTEEEMAQQTAGQQQIIPQNGAEQSQPEADRLPNLPKDIAGLIQ